MPPTLATAERADRRAAPRTPLPEATVFIHGDYREYPVQDVSLGGFSVLDRARSFTPGDVYYLDILRHRWPVVENLRARVTRQADGRVGFACHSPDRPAPEAYQQLVEDARQGEPGEAAPPYPEFSVLRLRYKSRPEVLRSLVDGFLDLAPDRFCELTAAVEVADATRAAQAATYLADLAAGMQANVLATAFGQVAERLEDGQCTAVAPHLAALDRELTLVLEALDRLTE